MHPDVNIEGDTTFFQLLPPATNLTGVQACPRTILPPKPILEGTVHITARYNLEATSPPENVDFIGAPEFVALDKLYTSVYPAVAKELDVNPEDLQIRMVNDNQELLPFAVSVRVTNCQDHKCAVPMGEKMSGLGTVISQAQNIAWVSETQSAATSVLVTDHQDDRIPLVDLLSSSPQRAPKTMMGCKHLLDWQLALLSLCWYL